MVSLLTAIGIGSIVAAAIGWSVAISNHRQAWITALRDDLATFLKELEIMHHAVGNFLSAKSISDSATLEREVQSARVSVLFVQRRIILRLNREESLHIQLATKLDELMRVQNRVPDPALIDGMVDLARKVLKREWEVTKLGPLAKPVMYWRDQQKKS
jgi:hypothetical protein